MPASYVIGKQGALVRYEVNTHCGHKPMRSGVLAVFEDIKQQLKKIPCLSARDLAEG